MDKKARDTEIKFDERLMNKTDDKKHFAK